MTDVKTLLQANFPQIDRVFFEVEKGVTYLRVITPPSDLASTTQLTQAILALLETENVIREFVLDVYAEPPSRAIPWAALADAPATTKLEVNLVSPVHGLTQYTGTLVSVSAEALVLRYNAKGQMRKIILPRANIATIEKALPY